MIQACLSGSYSLPNPATFHTPYHLNILLLNVGYYHAIQNYRPAQELQASAL